MVEQDTGARRGRVCFGDWQILQASGKPTAETQLPNMDAEKEQPATSASSTVSLLQSSECAESVAARVMSDDVRRCIHVLVKQEVQHASEQISSKLSKLATDLQLLENGMGRRRHHAGLGPSPMASQLSAVKQEEMPSASRISQMEQTLNDMVSMHWSLAKQGNDLLNHVEKMNQRIQRVESSGASNGSCAKAAVIKGGKANLAIPLVPLGGDLGPFIPAVSTARMQDSEKAPCSTSSSAPSTAEATRLLAELDSRAAHIDHLSRQEYLLREASWHVRRERILSNADAGLSISLRDGVRTLPSPAVKSTVEFVD